MGYYVFIILLIYSAQSSVLCVTNRRDHNYPKNFRRHVESSPPTDWETGLREATYQALLRERHTGSYLRDNIYSAPVLGHKTTATPFGDITVLARGQLYFSSGGFQFVQDPNAYDCDECSEQQLCGSTSCKWSKPLDQGNLLALWVVRRIRHRDARYGHRYEMEYTVSPVTSLVRQEFVMRNGFFDYSIPGHIFVAKSNAQAQQTVPNYRTLNRDNIKDYPGDNNRQWHTREKTVNRKYLPAKNPESHNSGGYYLPPYTSTQVNPVSHFKPGILIGISPNGYKHIIHALPKLPSDDREYYRPDGQLHQHFYNQDATTQNSLEKEVELYKHLLQSLAAKTSTSNPPGTTVYVPTNIVGYTTHKSPPTKPTQTTSSKQELDIFGEIFPMVPPSTVKTTQKTSGTTTLTTSSETPVGLTTASLIPILTPTINIDGETNRFTVPTTIRFPTAPATPTEVKQFSPSPPHITYSQPDPLYSHTQTESSYSSKTPTKIHDSSIYTAPSTGQHIPTTSHITSTDYQINSPTTSQTFNTKPFKYTTITQSTTPTYGTRLSSLYSHKPTKSYDTTSTKIVVPVTENKYTQRPSTKTTYFMRNKVTKRPTKFTSPSQLSDIDDLDIFAETKPTQAEKPKLEMKESHQKNIPNSINEQLPPPDKDTDTTIPYVSSSEKVTTLITTNAPKDITESDAASLPTKTTPKTETTLTITAAKEETSLDTRTTTKEESTHDTRTTTKGETMSNTKITTKEETTLNTRGTTKKETTPNTTTTSKEETTPDIRTTSKEETTPDTRTTTKEETTPVTSTTTEEETTLDTKTTTKEETTLDTKTTTKEETTLVTKTTTKEETTPNTKTTTKEETTLKAETTLKTAAIPTTESELKTDTIEPTITFTTELQPESTKPEVPIETTIAVAKEESTQHTGFDQTTINLSQAATKEVTDKKTKNNNIVTTIFVPEPITTITNFSDDTSVTTTTPSIEITYEPIEKTITNDKGTTSQSDSDLINTISPQTSPHLPTITSKQPSEKAIPRTTVKPLDPVEEIFGDSFEETKSTISGPTSMAKIIDTKEIDDLFGDTSRSLKDQEISTDEIMTSAITKANPKIIYSNFYVASTAGPTSSLSFDFNTATEEQQETTVNDDFTTATKLEKITTIDFTTPMHLTEKIKVNLEQNLLQTTTETMTETTNKEETTESIIPSITPVSAQPITRQSYSTSISFVVNKKNKTNAKMPSTDDHMTVKAKLTELDVNNTEYSVYRAEYPETTEMNMATAGKASNTVKAFDELALSLVNHARSIDYLNSKNNERKYKRKSYNSKYRSHRKKE